MKTKPDFQVGLDRKLAWTGGGSVRYVVARVVAPELNVHPEMARKAKNLAVVLDRSGSMDGKPLELAKEAVLKVIGMLRKGDRFTLVLFDSEAKIVFAGRRVETGLVEDVARLLRGVRAGSNTNLSSGWFEGARHVAAVMEEGHAAQNHVLLLSDGQANEGITDLESLGKHAAELGKRGLTSSAIGVGEGYDQTQLRVIAEQGGGRLHDAQYPHEIVEVVEAEMAGMLTTTMESVEMTLAAPEGVEVECLSGYPGRFVRGVLRVTLGMLSGGKWRDAVFLVKLPDGNNGEEVKLDCSLFWRAVGNEKTERMCHDVKLTYAAGKQNTAQPRDMVLALRVMGVWHASMILRAVEMNRLGDFEGTKAMLKVEIEKFRRYAKGLEGGDAKVEELERLLQVAGREWNERGRKEGTAAAVFCRSNVEDGRTMQRLPFSPSQLD